MTEPKQVLSTWLERPLLDAVEREAEKQMVSKAAVVRWALMTRYPSVVAEMRSDDDDNGKERDAS